MACSMGPNGPLNDSKRSKPIGVCVLQVWALEVALSLCAVPPVPGRPRPAYHVREVLNDTCTGY
eukprot:2734458-Alexandrium_andersonii.AAC.1